MAVKPLLLVVVGAGCYPRAETDMGRLVLAHHADAELSGWSGDNTTLYWMGWDAAEHYGLEAVDAQTGTENPVLNGHDYAHSLNVSAGDHLLYYAIWATADKQTLTTLAVDEAALAGKPGDRTTYITTHALPEQSCPEGQAWAQLPQLAGSLVRSRQVPVQLVRPAPQLTTHTLPVHTSPVLQVCPQAPPNRSQ